MGIELSQVIPWGRSFDEYRQMFDLSASDLARTILGVADGPPVSIIELLRVAGEIRIFPLLTLNRTRSPYVQPLLDRATAAGLAAGTRKAPHEFQKGGDEMLVIAAEQLKGNH